MAGSDHKVDTVDPVLVAGEKLYWTNKGVPYGEETHAQLEETNVALRRYHAFALEVSLGVFDRFDYGYSTSAIDFVFRNAWWCLNAHLPLHAMLAGGYDCHLEMLLLKLGDAGVDVKSIVNLRSLSNPALHIAMACIDVESSRREAMTHLLKNGADPNGAGRYNNTPLVLCRTKADAELLLSWGADKTKPCRFGWEPYRLVDDSELKEFLTPE
jgi:hypothetical protein